MKAFDYFKSLKLNLLDYRNNFQMKNNFPETILINNFRHFRILDSYNRNHSISNQNNFRRKNIELKHIWFDSFRTKNERNYLIYTNFISFLINRSTVKFKTKTKTSLTKVDYTTFLNNSSFFSDMNSGSFQNLIRLKTNKSFYKTNYSIISHLKNMTNLPKPSFKHSHLHSIILKQKPTLNYLKLLMFLKNKDLTHFKHKPISSLRMINRLLINKLNSNPFQDVENSFLRNKLKRVKMFTKKRNKLLDFNFDVKASNKTKTPYTKENQIRESEQDSIHYNSVTTLSRLFKNDLSTLSYYTYLIFLSNPFLFKLKQDSYLSIKNYNKLNIININSLKPLLLILKKSNLDKTKILTNSNINPSKHFHKTLTKQAFDFFSSYKFYQNIVPWYYNTLIRFFEHISGTKALIQIYPFVNQHLTYDWLVRYRSWLPRMSFYERMLGHKFFLEEALHIIHLSFIYKDSKLFASWLKAIILRISFWKTRSIFRFIKYLMLSHFYYVFRDLEIKGLKIRLKGKISVAGNSRKRSILYRIGKTSYSQTSLRVSHTKSTINTFTGVMGFQVWIFY